MSSLFDATLPQRITSSHTLVVKGASSVITVGVTVDAAIAKPGKKAGFTVTLKDAAGNPVAGEVAVFVVDKAFLDIKPHPSHDLNAKLDVDLAAGNRPMVSNTGGMLGGTRYASSKGRVDTLHAKDVWVNPYWPTTAGRSNQFDLGVDQYVITTAPALCNRRDRDRDRDRSEPAAKFHGQETNLLAPCLVVFNGC